MNARTKFGLMVLLALALCGALALGLQGNATAQTRAPAISKQITYLLYPTTAISGAATTYTASPRTLAPGLDASKVNGWANVDIFATIDLASAGNVTLTLQYSADGTNWADADYEYATGNTTGTVGTQTYVRYLTADGTELIQAPTAGEFVRLKMASTVSVTPTVYATYRN